VVRRWAALRGREHALSGEQVGRDDPEWFAVPSGTQVAVESFPRCDRPCSVSSLGRVPRDIRGVRASRQLVAWARELVVINRPQPKHGRGVMRRPSESVDSVAAAGARVTDGLY
jgi:hypothetical protein